MSLVTKRRSNLVGAAAILAILSAAPAQPGFAAAAMPGMPNMPATGQHDMPATVSAVDMKTGLLDVVSEGFNLRLHFPPEALANVKKGDRITLHLGFTKL